MTRPGIPDKRLGYKVICVSMYDADIEQLDAKVAELRSRGARRPSKSALIRAALAAFDLDKFPVAP